MNSDLSSVVYEYEQILLGKNKAFVNSFDNDLPNEKVIAYLWRYVIEELLHWTPQQAVSYMTMETVHQLHLQNTIKKISTPPGISNEKIPLYVLSLCYPKEVKYSIQKQVIDEYERVLASPTAKFAKNYFDDAQALQKAVYCMNYAITASLSDMTVNDLYIFFADEEKAREWLATFKLADLQLALFDSPLDLFHYTSFRNSNFLYLSHKLNAKIAYS